MIEHTCVVCVCMCSVPGACATMPVWVKRKVAKAADTQDRYLSGIRPVRFMAICSESVHPLAIMEWLEEKVKLQVQQKSIRLSRTIQPFPLRGVLAPNLCLLTLLHSSSTDSALSFQTGFACHVLFMAAVWPQFYMTTRTATVTQQSYHSCLGRAVLCNVLARRWLKILPFLHSSFKHQSSFSEAMNTDKSKTTSPGPILTPLSAVILIALIHCRLVFVLAKMFWLLLINASSAQIMFIIISNIQIVTHC